MYYISHVVIILFLKSGIAVHIGLKCIFIEESKKKIKLLFIILQLIRNEATIHLDSFFETEYSSTDS